MSRKPVSRNRAAFQRAMEFYRPLEPYRARPVIDREAEERAIAEHLARKGVTRCPPARKPQDGEGEG